MATADQIAAMRRMIGELADAEPWTDAVVSALIDTYPDSINEAAMNGWQQKASMFAGMVDTSESGSSRKQSQVFEQALSMAAYYRKLWEAESPTTDDPDLTGSAYALPIVRT